MDTWAALAGLLACLWPCCRASATTLSAWWPCCAASSRCCRKTSSGVFSSLESRVRCAAICAAAGPSRPGAGRWLDAYERTAGWRLALQEAQAAEPAILAGDWSSASGYEIGNQIATDDSVTAVLCANDHMALGLLRALSEHGRRVPGDVSVVGFDDIPESAYFLPPLTTVRQNFGELGRRALSALVDLIHGRAPAGSLEPVAPRLVVRSSAGPPEMYAVDLDLH